jgi:peptidoglycan/LPS O-acetylase OafA/YrhL
MEKKLNHLQSLRAISVLFIFLYHTKIQLFSRGYLGVDIFFVISGFIITKQIFESYLKKDFIDLKNFYIKRIKRIYPNLFFIVFITYLSYFFFGPPDISLYEESIYSMLGISNIYYSITTRDYFDNIFNTPLIHTWSLGLELQFYLILPIIIFFFKIKKKFFNVNTFLFIIFIISFLFYLIDSKTNSIISFYNPGYRVWEFLIGTFFYLYKKNIKTNEKINFFLLATIFFLFFFGNYIDSRIEKIIILAATGYLIASYKNNFILENKYLIFIGDISYSFYLWHLPVLFFFEIYFADFIIIKIIACFFITFLLSIFTYSFIERNTNILLIGTILFLLFLTAKYFNKGLINKTLNTFRDLNYLQMKFDWNNRIPIQKHMMVENNLVYKNCLENNDNTRLDRYALRNKCLKKKDNTKIFFLFGDSHSAQFLPLLNENKTIRNLYYLHYMTPQLPPIETIKLLTDTFKEVYLITNVDNLNKFEIIKNEFEKINNYKVKLILFNSTPKPIEDEPTKCLIQQKNCFINKSKNIEKRNLQEMFIKMIEYEKKNINRVFIFDSFEHICGENALGCLVYDKINNIIYFRDDQHITAEAARKITNKFNNFISEKKILD